MRIQFCGADRAVTGSCHLIEVNGLRLLLDFGMHQGAREESRRLNQWLPEDAKDAHALILSHGHLDHCGKIPVLTRAGFGGPIYCTPATAEVARIVLEDAAEIQEEDAMYLNQRLRGPDEPTVRPLYVPSDIPLVRRLMKRTPYRQRTDLGNDVSFTFLDAGHILGSTYVLLEWEEEGSGRKALLFTADIGRYNTPIIHDPEPLAGPVDYVITESTYGGRAHAPMAEVEPQLLDAVKYCVQHRSRLIVPSFAVGRTQTILWYMQRFIQAKEVPAIPIYVDSPMGVEVSHVHTDFRENYDEETLKHIGDEDLFAMTRVTFASSADQSRKINADRGPCVIIASSPTCEFGRVLHHLKQSVEREHDMVVFVGWTPHRTLGRRLQDGEKRARIYDRWYDVRCQVRTIHGLSAHADQNEILKFLAPTIRRETSFFVVHGEDDQAEALASALTARGAGTVTVPALETSTITV
jgi:metallo-beta-lactamase family protein